MTELTDAVRLARAQDFQRIFEAAGVGPREALADQLCRPLLAIGGNDPAAVLHSAQMLDEIGGLSRGGSSFGLVSRAFAAVADHLVANFESAALPETRRLYEDSACILLCYANLSVQKGPADGVEPTHALTLVRSFQKLAEKAELPHVVDLMSCQINSLSMRVDGHQQAIKLGRNPVAINSEKAELYAPLVGAASAVISRLDLARIMYRPTAA